MMKLLATGSPSRHIWGWTSPSFTFSASAPASGSTTRTAMGARFHVKQQLSWLSQHSLPGSKVTEFVGNRAAATGILGKLGIGSSINQWVSGGARAVEWQPGRFIAPHNVLPLGKGAVICSSSDREGDGDSYSGNGNSSRGVDVEPFRGRGRGGRSGRGRGGGGRGSSRPAFDRSAPREGQKRFYSIDGGQREEFRSSPRGGFRGRGRGRGSFGNGEQRDRFSRPPGGEGDNRDRGSFGDGGKFGGAAGEGNMASFRGRGRGRGRGSGGYGGQREQFRSPQRETDRQSFGGRGSFGNGAEGDRESFRGRGRGSFGGMRRGRGSFRGISRSPSPYYRDSNSETDATPQRWDYSAPRTRGGRGSFRGSRGGRGEGGRGRGSSYARGGRPSSNFGDRRLSEDGEIQESRPPLRRGQLFEGEEKWQRKVREKKAKTTSYAHDDDSEDGGLDDDDPEEGGHRYPHPDGEERDPEEDSEGGVEVWRRKKINWLCKEIPVLRPTGIVTMLNSQRKWIHAVDSKEVMETLMRRNEILRAHRVLKWTMQQSWFENDFDLNTKMANMLGNNGKLTRMRELFDTIIATGQVPDISTYVILIKAYIADETSESVDEAYTIYTQMEQLGGYQQPAAVASALFQAFTDRKGGAHLRHLHQADALFESMKKKGTSWRMGLTPEVWRTMYTALIHMHSVQGNGARVYELVADMKEAALSLHPDCYTALIRLCSKDGDTAEAERVFNQLAAAGHKPDWRAYVALIQTYGVAGMSDKVHAAFAEMETEGVHVNLNVFEAVVEAMVKAGDIEGARAALFKAEEKFASVLHGCYNFLMEWYKSKDMLPEIEDLFTRMKEKKCRPNLQAYNNLIDSYVLRGQLDQAEAIYEAMKSLSGFHPNLKTCTLMIEAFWRAGLPEKVKEVYAYLTERNMKLTDEVMANVAEIVGEKKIASEEKAKSRKLIPEQREMLVGVLLGGAKVASHDRNRTYEITFELGDNGAILIHHLYDMFADWAQQAPRTDVDDDGPPVHRFATVSHGSLRFYAHQYRPEGNPVIPRLIHRWLNPLSLAYWYMYGGEKCKTTGGIILNACHYTSKELTLVVKALKARTVDCVIKRRRSGNVLLFKDESAAWVWRLMEPHVLDELKDLLRPDMAMRSRGNIAGPQAFDEDAELKVTDEADLGVDEDMGTTGAGVPVKVGSFETY